MRISDLKVKLVAANAISEKVIKDHSDIREELTFIKTKADLKSKVLNARLSNAIEEMVDQYNKAEALSKSTLDLRAKFCWAKEQLHKYKKKARSFYR